MQVLSKLGGKMVKGLDVVGSGLSKVGLYSLFILLFICIVIWVPVFWVVNILWKFNSWLLLTWNRLGDYIENDV